MEAKRIELQRIMDSQEWICKKFGVPFLPPDLDLKIGISEWALQSRKPFHGLRHPMEKDTLGWYFWSGEFEERDDFFRPLHAVHLIESHPWLLQYLALPPGWRLLIAEGYEDIWYDEKLLKI